MLSRCVMSIYGTVCIAAKFAVLESYSSYANVKLCSAVRAWLVLFNWHPKTAAKKNKNSKYSKNNYQLRKTWTNLKSLIPAKSRFGPVKHALIAESRFGQVNHASIAQSHFWSNHVLIAESRVEPVNHTLIAASRFGPVNQSIGVGNQFDFRISVLALQAYDALYW